MGIGYLKVAKYAVLYFAQFFNAHRMNWGSQFIAKKRIDEMLPSSYFKKDVITAFGIIVYFEQ